MGGSLALDGVTVLELTTGLPGAYCGRLLAMLGADVVKVESPHRPDEARAAATGADRFLHAQKRSVVVDLATANGERLVERLASNVDVVLDDGALGEAPDVRVRYDALLAADPRLILVAFSPYGLDGPRAGWQSTELTELAAGGWLPHGPHGGPPVMPGAPSARCGAGTFAALGALLAIAARRTSGAGQLVEVCLNEAFVHLLTAPTVFFTYTGLDMPRMGDGYPFGIYPCADGSLGVSVLTQGHWQGLCRLMGRPDLIDDPRYRTGVERANPEVAAELDRIVAAWAAEQSAHSTFHAAQAMRVAVTIVASPTEVLSSPQYAARGYWVDVDDDELGMLRLPSTPFQLASGAFATFRPAPRVGADTDAVLATIVEASA
ncbi:MAG: CoA transferase [Ilumatobacteraceae bacterium]|nr:CoA transferase [Ilumatobacteraceae bacterium]